MQPLVSALFWNSFKIENEDVTIAVESHFEQCEVARKKKHKKRFRGFNGIRTHSLCVGTAVLYHIFIFICIPAAHIVSFCMSFCVSFLSRVDELGKLADSQGMGLHSAAARALQREHRGHGFESR